MINKFGSSVFGLGDVLILTSICKYFPGELTIQLPEKIKRFSILFDGLANVEITENVKVLPDIGYGHYSTTKLRNFFGSDADFLDNRPIVLHYNMESEQWANNYLSKFKNPIIFVVKCAKEHDNVRSLPNSLVIDIYNKLINSGFTPILCQSSKNNSNVIDCEKLIDLDLSKYISILRKCGRYVGANTGDMHLAIATGCKVDVFQPRSGGLFFEDNWNYNHPNISYFNF